MHFAAKELSTIYLNNDYTLGLFPSFLFFVLNMSGKGPHFKISSTVNLENDGILLKGYRGK